MKAETVTFEGSPQKLLRFTDDVSGVAGIVVIDSVALGPAAGGCRLWHYADAEAMVRDAQRLARGMTYKNALAGLPLGGGKSVIHRRTGPSIARRCSGPWAER